MELLILLFAIRIATDALPVNYGALPKIALVGPLADDEGSQCGGYYHSGASVVTVKTALEKQLGADRVLYSRGANPTDQNTSGIAKAVALAASCDLTIVVVGDTTETCGEMFDRSNLDLPGGQLALLEAVAATPTKTIVVLIHGRTVTFGRGNPVLAKVAGLFSAWRPGEEGGTAIVNLIGGVDGANPSGRLPQAWPRSVGGVQGPGAPYLYPFQGNHMGETYATDGPSTPLFAFGSGLSYTSYVLSNLAITPNATTAAGNFSARLIAQNTGTRDGDAIVQVYFRDPVAFPVRIGSVQLVAYERVHVPAGSAVNVTVGIRAADMAYWDDGSNGADARAPGWVVDPGAFQLVFGTAGFTSFAHPEGLRATVYVTAEG